MLEDLYKRPKKIVMGMEMATGPNPSSVWKQ
jgi:hypothetical protein